MGRTIMSLIILYIVLVAIFPPVVLAKDEKMATTTVESITVTANKIEQDVQEVPQSITVLDEETLENKEIHNIADIIREIPNTNYAYSNIGTINFRGINSSVLTNNHPLVIYIDGVPFTNRSGYEISLVNVERVEVLRGPQGTLYGKDSIGGIINVITREPTNVYEGKADLEYGNYNTFRGTLSVNGPIVKDILFLSLFGRYTKDDGWIDNHYLGMDEDANSMKEENFGLNLVYTPTDRFLARLVFHHDYINHYGFDESLIPLGNTNINAFDTDDAKDTQFDVATFNRSENDSGALSFQYLFDTVVFNALSTYKYIDALGSTDQDAGVNPLYTGLKLFKDGTVSTFSQELRLSNQEGNNVRWLGGLYYEHEKFVNDRFGFQLPGVFLDSPFDIELNSVSEGIANTIAVFGQVILPFVQSFELTLGGRYQYIKKEIDLESFTLPIGMTGPPSFSLDAKHEWDILSPRASLLYRLTSHLNLYTTVSTGSYPGGYNRFAASGDEEAIRFDEQTSINYEAGFKFNGDALSLTTNVFYMDIADIHIFKIDNLSGMVSTSNAGKAHSLGAELEFAWQFAKKWALDGSFGVIQAEYDEYNNFAGNTIEKTPVYKAIIGLQYQNSQGVYGRIDFRGTGSTYFDAANTLKGDEHFSFDAKIGYRFANWDLYTYVKNISDESRIIDAINFGMAGTRIMFSDPRTIAIGLRYTF